MVVRAFLVIEEAMVFIVVTVAEDICGEGISGDGHGS